MLGGEIYYRAIGRPWGPAADFIVTVKPEFHPLTAVATDPHAHSSLSQAGRREYSAGSTIRGPPARAVHLSRADSVGPSDSGSDRLYDCTKKVAGFFATGRQPGPPASGRSHLRIQV
jgi:hypothetical protein